MTLENRLAVLRRAMADLTPAQRDVCQDFLLGFVSVYVPEETWDECVRASVGVALKCHATRGRQSNYGTTDLGGEKTAEGGAKSSKDAADTAGATLTIPSGKDSAAGPDA